MSEWLYLYFALIILYAFTIYFLLRKGFFSILFTFLVFVVLLLGPAMTFILNVYFDVPISDGEHIFKALLYIFLFFVFYFLTCIVLPSRVILHKTFIIHTLEVKIMGWVLMCIGVGSLVLFVSLNGFLFFIIENYDDVFSDIIKISWIRKFFYFFYPAAIIFYFLSKRTFRSINIFLVFSLVFGILSFLAVGGSRANIAIAVMLYLIIGIYEKHIKLRYAFISLPILMSLMSILALVRYGFYPESIVLNIISLAKGTFSPWENIVKIVSAESEIEYQWLWPFIRDFYQYFPKSLWLESTDAIWNTGNYLTKIIMGYSDSLIFSPTVIGSLVIIAGVYGVIIGACVIAIVLWFLDILFFNASRHVRSNGSQYCFGSILLTYCFCITFYVIGLTRDGVDGFFSRVTFFTFWYLIVLIFSLVCARILPRKC